MGHGWSPQPLPEPQPDHDGDYPDPRVTEAEEVLNRYFSDTFKDTQGCLHDTQAFFEGLSDVTEVIVLGHSISDVDLPYFETIAKSTEAQTPNWIVSYYDQESPPFHAEQLAKVGIGAERIEHVRIEELRHPSQSALA